MNAPAPSPPPPPPPPAPQWERPRLTPSLLGAWRGIWLFTWRTQLTWRRAPLLLVWLLILPFLIWATVHSPQTWNRAGLPLGEPSRQMNGFARRLARAQLPIQKAEERNQLTQIIAGEYERIQRDARSASGPETSVADQKAMIESCHTRIVEKARSLLEARQLREFQAADKEWISNAEDQVGEPAWNRTAPFYHWLVDLYFFIFLPLSCVRSCGGLIRDELQSDTLGFLITRPVKRATLLALKYAAQVLWLEMVVLVEGLFLFGAGALRHIPQLGPLLPLFLAAQFLAVPAWSALGLFLGQVTKRYLPVALVYGLIVELGIGDIPTNINTLSMMRHLKTLLSNDPALQSLYEWSGTGVVLPVGALLLGAALFLALAAVLFTFREYHAAAEMQK
ncbi:MAG: ABC transporter permease [Verrucomicrobiota bacterium]